MEPLSLINNTVGRSHGRNRDGQLGFAVAAIATAGAGVIGLVKKIKPIFNTFKKIGNVFGAGGSDQDRLIKRYYEMKDALVAAGYTNVPLGDWLDKHNVRKTDLKNNQKQPYWKAAYARLRLLFIDWLNYSNPGLGTDYGLLFPEWKMVNEGQIHSGPVEAMKLIVKDIPKGTYKPGTLSIAVLDTPETTAATEPQDLITKVIDGYTLVKDAQGQIKEIRDAAGKLVNPTDERYAQVTSKDIEVQEASMGTAGKIVLGVIGASILTYMATQSGDASKKKPVNGVPRKKKIKKSKSAKS